MKFIKTTATATLALTAMAGLYGINAAAHDHKDNSESVSQTFDLQGFDEILVGGVFEVDVKVGPGHSVSMKGDPRMMERVEASVENGKLHLGLKKSRKKKKKHGHTDGIEVTVTLPALNALSISGVASGEIDGVDAGNFQLRVSGVAEVDIDGSCDTLDAKVSGVGELDAKDFKCKNADIKLSGVGEMSVYASESVDVSASGVGSVDVYGKPEKIEKSKSMFTEINIR